MLCLREAKPRDLVGPILEDGSTKRHLVHVSAYCAAPIGCEFVELLVILVSIASGIALEIGHADMCYHVNVPELRESFEQIK